MAKRSIRHGVFETNSSSMHSLTILNEDAYCNYYGCPDSYVTEDKIMQELHMYLNKDKTEINFSEEEMYYGRYPFRIFDSFISKLKYIAAYYAYFDNIANLIPIVQKFIPTVKNIRMPSNNHIGFDEPYLFTWFSLYHINAYDVLRNYKYVIIQDGDEYQKWEDLFRVGLMDNHFIEKDYVRDTALTSLEEEI